jgi:hypothetical protein
MTVDHVRYQWDDGRRQLEAAGQGTARSRHLLLLVDAVVDELRRRVGQTYTLNELAGAYRGSEEWVREVVLRETLPKARAGVRDTTLVQDAAFAQYAHGATDYRP